MPNANPILPTSSDAGRNSLMAAIRSTGGFGSLKKSGTLKNVSPNEKNGLQKSTHKFNGGNDMASSLAAVLNQRKTAMQSDDENEDDDDDWK
ncbi:uncharacterized protein B0P05DRAFT_377973 [Gilbertella persicaria]|uniref:uncharacterized protein n=1 Tax=Gilbertella persicaria TaxID=101096 RepID=UPI00221EA6B2|nr:uncharacterized protein B0P05DRAFT_377973 [Gilbertella persicaria]KAI8047094.1 hypothetical protein B0P05DRAFT_377973 [Gilbertella persicaria]